MIYYFSFSSLLGGLIALLTGFVVYFKNRNNILNKTWLWLSLSVAIWSTCYFLLITSPTKDNALIYNLVLHYAAIFIPAFYLHFIFSLIGLSQKKRITLFLCYTMSFALASINHSTLFVKDVLPKYIFNFYPDAGKLYFLFFLDFFIWINYALYELFMTYKNTTGFKSLQIKYVGIASIAGFIGGGSVFLLTFNIPAPPFGLALFSLYPIVIAYSIVKYRLMDITVAITRTTIFVFVYSLVLGIPFFIAKTWRPWLEDIFKSNWYFVPLGFLGFLAMTGPSIYLYIQKKAENRLLREQRRYQETLRQASAGMVRIRDLKKLLNLIVYMVRRAVKLTHVCIYLFDEKANQYTLQAVRDQNRVFVTNLELGNHLVKHLREYRKPLVYEELKRLSEDKRDLSFVLAEAEMKRINASVIVPSFVEDKLLGFIAMGDKLSGKIFTEDDLAVFSVLANQAALAIENAQFYDEVQETQEQLFQAEKMATLGTMADGLSHQINNRFHAMGLIAGDALDSIKLTNAESLPEDSKKLLGEIKHALEKVQDNVMQGGEVVKGLLKYSRPGEEGFEAITLDQIIDASLEMVQYKVKLKELDFVRDYAKDLPKAKVNLTQLQEVFFNLIDNANDAMRQRKEELKEADYRPKITVNAQGLDNVLQIKISDNGIGVKKEDFHKLFTPFFTTKASSRKGTGLGLFVIKKIVTSNHGQISVESEYQKGTTFTIELPVAK
ncbi:MAG: ATP-binding protein [Candidatus Omnitrophota bacterium]